MSARSESAGGGFGLGTVVFAVFLTLKLTGYIDWSWWWVTAPLWIPFAVAAAFMALFALFCLVAAVIR